MKILTCTCCGAELTAPQFHNGKPYGWTCIKKVDPARKQVKVKFYPVEVLASRSSPLKSRGEAATALTFKYNGKAYRAHVAASQMTEQDGTTFLSEHVFKNLK